MAKSHVNLFKCHVVLARHICMLTDIRQKQVVFKFFETSLRITFCEYFKHFSRETNTDQAHYKFGKARSHASLTVTVS